MARKFKTEDEIKAIINKTHEIEPVAGMIFKLCWVRNFRTQDVRFAIGSDFKKDNGYPYYYLRHEKTRIKTKKDEWYPIPIPIYNEIQKHINTNRIGSDDYVFVITKQNPGIYQGHTGVISRNWLIEVWYKACKEVGVYSEDKIIVRNCNECPHSIAERKCDVLGNGKLRNRDNVHINQCKNKGITKIVTEKHPRIHESLRAGGAISKIKYYMRQGDDYEVAKAKVFNQSNWQSWDVYNRYMDAVFEKKQGDKQYIKDFISLEV